MHAACGKCPASIPCHNGILKRIVLCPMCGVFQVILEQIHWIKGTKITDNVTWRIQCPMRYIEEDQYNVWCRRCEGVTITQDTYVNVSQTNYDILASLHVRILIPDQGPPQKHYTSNISSTNSTIPMGLCARCYGVEHVLRIS